MCYIRQPWGSREHRLAELSAPCWVDLAKEARDHGMVFLVLTGGEILLRHDFFDIYGPLTRLGLIVTLFTNATLITGTIAERLAQAPPNLIEITLYGATAKTYEAVTGLRDGFSRCCAGIEALVHRKVPILLKTTITRQNLSELGLMQQMAHNWGAPFASSWLLSRRPDGTPSEVDHCRIALQDGIHLESRGRASLHDPSESLLRNSSPQGGSPFFCHAGRSAFVISATGRMNVCPALSLPAAEPLTTSFANAWTQIQAFTDLAPPISSQCASCDVKAYCDRCPAWSFNETGTLSGTVPYLCQIAHAREAQHRSDCTTST